VAVLLIATGGTIASTVQPDGGVAVALDGRELLDSVDGLDVESVDVQDLSQGPSWNLDLDEMSTVSLAARKAASTGTGVVITHGTDSLEETAYLTDLVAGEATDRVPIVVTGSMRNAGQPDGDGPQNLRDAFAVARSSEARGRGVLVVAAGDVHAARWVTKTDTQAVDTFRSPGHGPVGRVDAGAVHFDRGPARAPAAPIDGGQHVVIGPIAIVPSYGDADAELIDWHLDRGVRGVVVEGTGAGNVNAALVPGLERARDRNVPVVITSRCMTGRVAPIYGGPGGGHSIASLGVIEGGDLSARKARLALAVALALGPAVDVRDWFASLVS
jgi:L-asparaginase